MHSKLKIHSMQFENIVFKIIMQTHIIKIIISLNIAKFHGLPQSAD